DWDWAELSEARAVADSGVAWATNRRRYEDRWMYDSIPDSAAARLWPRAAAQGAAGMPGASAVPAPGRTRPVSEPELATETPRPKLSRDLLAASDRLLRVFPAQDGEGGDRASNQVVVRGKRSARGTPAL